MKKKKSEDPNKNERLRIRTECFNIEETLEGDIEISLNMDNPKCPNDVIEQYSELLSRVIAKGGKTRYIVPSKTQA